MNFQVRFTRYNGAKATRQTSGIWLTNADSFADAYDNARLFIQGMKETDPAWDYAIVSIETHGYSGERIPDHGPTIWEGPKAA